MMEDLVGTIRILGLFFFWQYWDLNAGPHNCQADTLLLDLFASPEFWFFFSMI
jgi:hypothetical protein